MADRGERRGLRRSLRGVAAAARPRAAHVHLAAPQGLHAKRSSTTSPRFRSSIRASTCRFNRPAMRVLRRMNRKYTLAQFHESVEIGPSRAFPDCAITTDIIVGFPGRNRGGFRSDARRTFAPAFSQTLLRSSIRLGAERRPLDGSRCRRKSRARVLTRLVDAQNRATRAYHDRKIGTGRARADRRRFQERSPTTLTAKTARQRHDRRAEAARLSRGGSDATHPYAQTPWLDVDDREAAHVWGCIGSSRRASRPIRRTPATLGGARRSHAT